MDKIEFTLYSSDQNEPLDSFWWRRDGKWNEDGSDILLPAICPKCHKGIISSCVDFDKKVTNFKCPECGFAGEGYKYDWEIPGDASLGEITYSDIKRSLKNLIDAKDEKEREEIAKKIKRELPRLIDAIENREYSIEEFYARYKKAKDIMFSKELDGSVEGLQTNVSDHVNDLLKAMDEEERKKSDKAKEN